MKTETAELIREQWKISTLYGFDNKLIITDEVDEPSICVEIDRVTQQILNTSNSLFYYEPGNNDVQCSALGYNFLSALNILLMWRGYRSVHGQIRKTWKQKFSPYFELFSAETEHISERTLNNESAVKFNNCIRKMRDQAKTDRLSNSADNQLRASRKNTQSALAYVQECFERHSKIEVVRVDLGFKQNYYNIQNEGEIDGKYIKARFAKLIRHTKRNFPSLVGWLARFEYGLQKLLHVHVMLLFNGHEVCRDKIIGQLIGRHWESLTNQEGCYFNCNDKKEGLQRLGLLGIGTIKFDDAKGRKNLDDAVEYMTKADYYIRLNTPEIIKTFVKGILTKKAKDTRGRPRQIK